ncbi:tRNA uracil 4-sulfurtransferase ThiI [Ruminococcus sp. 210702-SL.1.03]|uniref:tRNA uracil 4-sulfurtransferase ThiI n=1 Tax=Ruminococcus sp. 210702-SL.1.03 TaxID=2883233 RepID=UPI001D06B178|nr:tRNA uracil 4-sulfurtransferase ThiI [Ruminococcus sp. 210702-SL.1.03]MCB6616833.1 tRNA 4-thiouridine(8) synthase ThiI [Ruminococcus sp. 210702-SL.1.03]
MKEIILCKYGEIALKGLNKSSFESTLVKNVKRRLRRFGKFDYWRSQSTLYISPLEDSIDMDEVLEAVGKIFGIVKMYKALEVDKTMEAILGDTLDYLADALEDAQTFKVEAKRADKKFPHKSPEICAELGHVILEKFPHLSVDVHEPDVTVFVEIREKHAFVNAMKFDGAGGLPIGTSGRGMLLLSGGIDSPVAGYMLAKRGMQIQAIHFEAPPYTSERARLKVEKLAEEISEYCGDIAFHCVPFTDIQVAIRDNCPEELFTIIMRRLMMEIAQRICERENCSCLITGESLGQVASQTMGAIVCTDAACRMPVFRPCIGMDKSEIVEIARKIDTFDTSILPYEDCCTVFTPKHPRTRPVLQDVIDGQNQFDFEPMIAEAVENTKFKLIRCGERTVNL